MYTTHMHTYLRAYRHTHQHTQTTDNHTRHTQKCTSKGIRRQSIVLTHRISLQKEPMPCRPMPLLCAAPTYVRAYAHTSIKRVLEYGVRAPVFYGNLREQTGENGSPRKPTGSQFCSYRDLPKVSGNLLEFAIYRIVQSRNPVLQLTLIQSWTMIPSYP